MMKKLCTMLLCLGAAALSAQELTILHTTDIHGQATIAQIGTIIDQERTADKDLIAVDCGDISNGSPSAYTDAGASMIECLNAFKYDIFVPGNHEFRIGNKAFRRNCDLFTSGKVLGANIEFTDPAKAPSKGLGSWTVLERKGLKIAVIGLLCHRYDNWIGFSLYNGIRLISPVDTLKKIMPEVRAAKPDVVIVAAHLDAKSIMESVTGNENWSYTLSSALQELCPEASLILAGHTHRVVPILEVYPGCWEVQPPTHGKGIAKIKLTYDPKAKKVTAVTSEILSTKGVAPKADMPEVWVKNQAATKDFLAKPVAQLPEGVVLGRVKKDPASNDRMIELFAKAIADQIPCDGVFCHNYASWRDKKGTLTENDFFRLHNNNQYITVLTLTQEQFQTIKAEIEKRTPGTKFFWFQKFTDPGKQQTLRIAFDAYDVTGCDGALNQLRIIANGVKDRVDTDHHVRGLLRAYLMKLYPVK